MEQKRELFRLSIKRTGQLFRGTETIPCEVLDLTDKGMLIEADCRTAPGDQWQLEFQVTPAARIQCTIIVTHAMPSHFGARIAIISPEHQHSLSRFIDQLLALNVTGF